MRIVSLAPFGSGGEEAGVMYLLSNYLRAVFDDIIQLRCNGVFSSCDRDAETSWKRDIHSCFRCMHTQSKLRDWAGLGFKDLSTFLAPHDIEQSRLWVAALSKDELLKARYDDTEIWSLISGSFWNRFGNDKPDLNLTHHEQFIRRSYISALRMSLATKQFINSFMPNFAFVAGGWDFITRSFVRQGKNLGVHTAVFKWDLSSRSIHVVHPVRNTVLACELVLEGLTKMRADSKTWPYELVKMVEEILNFLEISEGQLMLPIAK